MVLISYNSSNQLNGLMSYIATLTGNKSEYLRFESVAGDNPEQLFYYDSGYSYQPTNAYLPEYYVGFFLKKNVFGLSSYTIRTSINPPNSTLHPHTWKIIGSIDGENWNILDSHVNDSVLCVQYATIHFEAQEYVVQHIRFVSATHFALRSLEFFGNLYPNNIVIHSCINNNFHIMFSCLISVFILV